MIYIYIYWSIYIYVREWRQKPLEGKHELSPIKTLTRVCSQKRMFQKARIREGLWSFREAKHEGLRGPFKNHVSVKVREQSLKVNSLDYPLGSDFLATILAPACTSSSPQMFLLGTLSRRAFQMLHGMVIFTCVAPKGAENVG